MNKLLLTPKECAEVLSIGITKFYNDIVKNPTFPKPVILGKTKLYRFADVMKWVESLDAVA